MTYDADEGLARAHKLAQRINREFQMKDCDEVLAALAVVISAYLKSLPVAERETELEDWLRLVRKLSGIGEAIQ